MKKVVYLIALGLGLLFSFKSSAFAATTLSIENAPSSLNYDQEFDLKVNLSCSTCSDSYLRGVFYPSGSSYFGYTRNNSGDWSNSPASGCLTFYKVGESEVSSGSWSGTLKFKPDKDSSYYNGPGEYLFKVGRYTSSCSSVSTWSNEVTIALKGSTPTPIPSNTPTPSPSLISPSPRGSSQPSPDLRNSSSASSEATFSSATLPSLLPAETAVPRTRTQEVLGTAKDNLFLLPITGGLIFLGMGILFVFRNKIRDIFPF